MHYGPFFWLSALLFAAVIVGVILRIGKDP